MNTARVNGKTAETRAQVAIHEQSEGAQHDFMCVMEVQLHAKWVLAPWGWSHKDVADQTEYVGNQPSAKIKRTDIKLFVSPRGPCFA